MKSKIKFFIIMVALCVFAQSMLCFAVERKLEKNIINSNSSSTVGGSYGTLHAVYNTVAKGRLESVSAISRYAVVSVQEYYNGSQNAMKSAAGTITNGQSVETSTISRHSANALYRYAYNGTMYNSVSTSTGVAETYYFNGYQQ